MQMEWEHEPPDLFSYLDYLKRREYNLIITDNAVSTISLQTHCGILTSVIGLALLELYWKIITKLGESNQIKIIFTHRQIEL